MGLPLTAIRPPVRSEVHPRIAAWMPGLADVYLAVLVFWAFAGTPGGWSGLLGDADTGFHIRAGDAILNAGVPPREHLFTFAVPGGHWYAFEWLSEVVFALLHRPWGLNGVVFFSGLTIAATLLLVVTNAVRRGAGGLVAILAGLAATSAASLHFHARPHIFTLLFLAVMTRLVDADRERQSRRLWLLVPLTLVWANLHAGFLIGLAWLGVMWFGLILERNRPLLVVRYAVLGVLCGAASLLNPYGWRLHLHLIETLRSSWYFELVDEFRATDFRSEAQVAFLVLLVGAMVVSVPLLRSRRYSDLLVLAVFGYLGVSAVRNIPVFMVIATPIVAGELSRLFARLAANSPRTSIRCILADFDSRFAPGMRRVTPWVVVFAALFVVRGATSGKPAAFPAATFPAAIAERHAGELAARRVFASDQWANYLIYRNFPLQRVYIDSQHHAYPPVLLRDTLAIMSAAKGWREALHRTGADALVCPVSSGLATRLIAGDAPEWRIVDRDGVALFATTAK